MQEQSAHSLHERDFESVRIRSPHAPVKCYFYGLFDHAYSFAHSLNRMRQATHQNSRSAFVVEYPSTEDIQNAFPTNSSRYQDSFTPNARQEILLNSNSTILVKYVGSHPQELMEAR